VKTRLLVASLYIFGSVAATAQLTGQFYLEKETFARGEPVFVYFSLVNHGSDTAMIVAVDQEQPFCSDTSITVSSDPAPTSSCPFLGGQGCVVNGAPRRRQPLLPGGTYIGRFLLNFGHEINAPGEYWVDAKRNIGPNHTGDVRAKLKFRVDVKAIAPNTFRPWLDQLTSINLEKRIEAARTLASVAPPSLEETLLGFADNPEFRRYAPLAFHRLNTRRSIEAMARLMEGPVTNEQIEAAQYLAETNDQSWYPLLRDAAEKNARISSYPAYAAELGGEKMLPVLVALEKSPDTKFTHLNAVMAMGSTGSRAAIPLLLEQLRSPDVDTSDRANYGLQLLTHRTAVQNPQARNREAEYIKWSRWWEREGATAPIYKDTECGEIVPLG
jgi:hypothetical protein